MDTEKPGRHLKGNVLQWVNDGWDLMIAHPPCTYFTNSAVCWLWNTPKKPKKGILYGVERWPALDAAARFFNELRRAPIHYIALENPIPHKYAIERIEGYDQEHKYDQLIQPWQFGHPEQKATCLWLKNLPPLEPTAVVTLPDNPAEAQKNHWLSPGPDRWKLRSVTYTGIANAMAEQWGTLETGYTSKHWRTTVSHVMSELGKRTSSKKKVSSAKNGKHGGRPITNSDPKSIARRLRYAQKHSD